MSRRRREKQIKALSNFISLTFFIFLSFLIGSSSVFSLNETLDEQLDELKNILDSSSSYSEFQKNQMLLPALQKVLNSGISFAETREIVEKGVSSSFDAYNMKKVLDILQETKEEDLPVELLINKVNEGLAKSVDKTTIISVISKKAENLKKANEILREAQQEGLEIKDGEEIIRIIGDSLENDVPVESLSWLIKSGLQQGKNLEEITEISEELSYLSLMAYDAGLSPDKIYLLFKQSIQSSTLVEQVCENIQKNLEAEISSNRIGLGETKPSSSTGGGATSPISITGEVSSPTAIEGTPAQEAGEAPTESGSAPEPPELPGGDSTTPPES